MHNMIVEDERDDYMEDSISYDYMGDKVQASHNEAPELAAFIANYKKIKNKETHTQLQADLIEHLWQNHPDLYKNISIQWFEFVSCNKYHLNIKYFSIVVY